MNKFFNEVGVPIWLPVDFDIRDVFNAEFHDKVDLNEVRFSSIFIVMENSAEIEKHFRHENYPEAIKSWTWLKEQFGLAWEKEIA